MPASLQSTAAPRAPVPDSLPAAPPPPDALPLRRRVLVTAAMVAYFIGGFHLVAALAPGRPAHRLATPLDHAIPFVPWTVWIYSWVYTSALYPAFVVRSAALFRRVVRAYLVVLTTSFACFAAFPVTSIGLRPDAAALDPATFVGWGLRLTYAVDPPYNLFPSLHLSVAAISALSAWHAAPALGAPALLVVAGIAVSICTTKQHYVADGAGALLLAALVYAAVLRPPAAPDPEPRSLGARGATLYLLFHSLVFGGLYAAYLLGWRA